MNLFVKGLPADTQILIAMGAAVAGGCQPCLKQLVELAKDQDLAPAQMRAAVTIGQFIKDQPAKKMKELAKNLLGVDPAGDPADDASKMRCGCTDANTAEAECCG